MDDILYDRGGYYYVYIHTVPNNMIYIGASQNPLLRWSNGTGYEENEEFFYDIQKYGWNNIKHEVLHKCKKRSEAEDIEQRLIILLDAENPNVGYNKTSFKNDLLEIYNNRYEFVPEEERQLSRTIRTGIIMDKELKERSEEQAKKELRSLNNLINVAVEKYLNEMKKNG